MNAQSQFIRNTFQAYYTVISTSFSLLGMATQPILASGPSKGGEEVRLCDLRLRTPHPQTPEVCNCVAFVCISSGLSFLFCFVWVGNLYPFDHGRRAARPSVCVRAC